MGDICFKHFTPIVWRPRSLYTFWFVFLKYSHYSFVLFFYYRLERFLSPFSLVRDKNFHFFTISLIISVLSGRGAFIILKVDSSMAYFSHLFFKSYWLCICSASLLHLLYTTPHPLSVLLIFLMCISSTSYLTHIGPNSLAMLNKFSHLFVFK